MEARRWGDFDYEVLQLVQPWDFGFDIDGDEEEDAVGSMRLTAVDDLPRGLVLYPGLQRPVGSGVTYSDCESLDPQVQSVVPDVDADGYPDVFVSCEDGPMAKFVNGQDGATIWEPELGDTLVAEPEDIDGDGCVDMVLYHRDTAELEVHRCRP